MRIRMSRAQTTKVKVPLDGMEGEDLLGGKTVPTEAVTRSKDLETGRPVHLASERQLQVGAEQLRSDRLHQPSTPLRPLCR
jgi:hypothetical protein